MKYTICETCNSSIGNNGLKKHLNSCTGQGKRPASIPGMRGKWSKGLTKETDSRVAQNGEKISAALKGKPGHSPTVEVRKILSDAAKRNGLGGVRQSKRIPYNGKILGSSYELKLAMSLDENLIAWDTCSRLPYKDPTGKSRTYTPDFYLPDYDVYLDPKNDFLLNNINPALGFSDKEKIYLVEQQNKIRVIILNKNELSWELVKQRI